jgi:hypothetical protein
MPAPTRSTAAAAPISTYVNHAVVAELLHGARRERGFYGGLSSRTAHCSPNLDVPHFAAVSVGDIDRGEVLAARDEPTQ